MSTNYDRVKFSCLSAFNIGTAYLYFQNQAPAIRYSYSIKSRIVGVCISSFLQSVRPNLEESSPYLKNKHIQRTFNALPFVIMGTLFATTGVANQVNFLATTLFAFQHFFSYALLQKSKKPPHLPLIDESTLLLRRRNVAIILSLSTLFLYQNSQQTHLTSSRRVIIRMMGIALSILSQEGAHYFEQKPTLALYALPFIILGGVFFATNLELKTNLLATALFGAQHLYLHSIHRDSIKGFLKTEEFRKTQNELETVQNGIVEDQNKPFEKSPATPPLDPSSFTEIFESEKYLSLWEELQQETDRADKLEVILNRIATKIGFQETLQFELLVNELDKFIDSELNEANFQIETLKHKIAALEKQLSSQQSKYNVNILNWQNITKELKKQTIELKIKASKLKADILTTEKRNNEAWEKCHQLEKAKEGAIKGRNTSLERLQQQEQVIDQLQKEKQNAFIDQLKTFDILEKQAQQIIKLTKENEQNNKTIKELEASKLNSSHTITELTLKNEKLEQALEKEEKRKPLENLNNNNRKRKRAKKTNVPTAQYALHRLKIHYP